MSVGTQASKSSVDQNLSTLAVQLRGVMQAAKSLNTYVNGQNTGLAALQALGYSAADAATALQLIGYLNTLAGAYYGTVQQGGSGGTGAILFNFDNALAQLWAAS